MQRGALGAASRPASWDAYTGTVYMQARDYPVILDSFEVPPAAMLTIADQGAILKRWLRS